MKLSVVIPIKNEDKFIGKCIDSIIKQNSEIEIIVIDNGSTDNTLDILRGYHERISVYKMDCPTISELRNYGVEISSGDWIAFVDGDVELSNNWYNSFLSRIDISKNMDYSIQDIVTGSTYICPNDPTWIEQVWYGQLVARNRNIFSYINSGNLIVHKDLFLKIGGFDPKYTTGEDVKFCEDARINGGIIIDDKNIQAIHHGYPKTIKGFFNRERWHGVGMKEYINKPWKSRSLSYAIYYCILLLLLINSIMFSGKVIMSVIIFLFLLLIPSIILSIIRGKYYDKNMILLAYLYFVYGWARLFSVFDMLFINKVSRNK